MSTAQQESKSTEQRVAIYTRISDDADKSGEGVARQKKDCLKRVEREGWRVVKVFEENDTGASRHSRKKRPKYAAMLAMAERGEIDLILSYSNSRLTRRLRELEDFVDLNARKGTRFCTIVSGDDDLSQPDGLMTARIKASVDAHESDVISGRVKRSVKERVEEGKWLGGPRPFGWGHTIEEVPDKDGKVKRTSKDLHLLNDLEAKMIQQAIKHVISGGTVGQILRLWTFCEIQTASGGKLWRHVGVNRILTRWSNAGIMEHQGKPLFEVKTNAPPICSREELEQVRAVLLDPARSKGPGGTPKHLLSGIPVCGKCGHALVSGAVLGRRKKGEGDDVPKQKYLMYRCAGPGCGLAMKRDALETLVVRHVLREYLHGGSAQRFESAKTEVEQLIAQSHQRLAVVLAERREVEEAINERLTSVPAMRPTLTRLAEQESELREEIERHYREDAHASMVASVAQIWHPSGDEPAYPDVVNKKGEVEVTFARAHPEVAAELDAIAKERGDKHHVSIAEAAVGMMSRWEAMPLEQRRKLIRALFTITVQPGRGGDRVEIGDRHAVRDRDRD